MRVGLGMQTEPQKIGFKKIVRKNLFLAPKIDHLKKKRPKNALLEKFGQKMGL